jgi:hypothetical protein
MIFDLQGKRRRAVQATYLILAILMGGGLIFFGVGSGSISGGLFDAITGNNSGGGSANSSIEKRIKKDEATLKVQPQSQTALMDLIRAHYQLATDDADANTGQFGPTGKQQLAMASVAWKKYVNLAKKPDDSLASLMLQAYSEIGLNKPAQAASAAEIIAAARPSAQAYLALTTYAAKAGQTDKANLAGQKAIQLAPKAQKKLVRQQVNSVKVNGAFGSQGGSGTPTGTPTGTATSGG